MVYFIMGDQGKMEAPGTPRDKVGIITDRVSEIKCSKCGCEIDVSEVESFARVECPDCHNIDTIPAKLGPFLLLGLIGTGGMGGVFKARDESLGRHVALKVMLKSIGEKTAFVEYFKREAQAVAKLNHPNIVQIYSFGQEKGQPYIVMELVGGQRFDKMIDGPTQLGQGLVMRIGMDICEGLKAAEEIGLLHGDIKPENILLDEKSRGKLVDFGIATFANQGNQEGIWGTPYYVAPEKIKRQKADQRSDIYSLGATLYHAIAKRPPFEGKTPIDVVKARLQHKPPALHIYRSDVNKEVEDIIMRMLELEPSKRYPNYGSLIGDIRKVLQSLGDSKRFDRDSVKKTGKIFITRKKDGQPTNPPTPPPQAQPTPPPQTRPAVQPRPTIQPRPPVPPKTVQPPKMPTQQATLESQKTQVTPESKAPVGTKIVFKKGKTIVAPAPRPTGVQPAPGAAPQQQPAHVTIRRTGTYAAGPQGAAQPTAAQQPPVKKGGGIGRVFLGIFLVLLVGGLIGLTIYLNDRREKKIKLRNYMMALESERSKATDAATRAKQISTKLDGYAKATRPYVDKVTNAVFQATTEVMETPAILPLPALQAIQAIKDKRKMEAAGGVQPAVPTQPEGTNMPVLAPEPNDDKAAPEKVEKKTPVAAAVPAKAPAEAPVAAPVAAPKPVEAAQPPPKRTDASGRDAPFGVETREAIDAYRRQGSTPAPTAPVADRKQQVEPAPAPRMDPRAVPPEERAFQPAAPVPQPAAPQTGESELKTLARQVLTDSATLVEMSRTMKEIETNIVALKEEILQTQQLDIAIRNEKDIEAFMVIATELEPTAKETFAKIDPAARKVEEIRQKVFTELEKKRKQEEEEKERQRKAEEEKRKADELKKLVETETDQANLERQNVVELVKQNQYKEAVDQLTKKLAELKSDEGKARMKGYVDRYTRLLRFKEFLIKKLNEDPFKWGYRLGVSDVDILGADESGLKLKSKTVPWNELQIPQMAKIFRRYVTADKTTPKQHSEHLIAMGLYYSENGDAKTAATYFQQAVDLTPSLADELKRLMPEDQPKKE